MISVINTAQIRIPSVEPTSSVISTSVGSGVGVSVALWGVAELKPNAVLKKTSIMPMARKIIVREGFRDFFI